MTDSKANGSEQAPHRRENAVNLAILALSVLAVCGGLFVYVDRDGPGRTEDAVVAADYIAVTAQVPGQIAELAVRDNQRVASGDVLFRLDDRTYQAEVAVARAEHASALATLSDKEALFQRSADAATDSAVSRQALADARAQRDQAQAAAHRTEGQLDLAKVRLDYCTVTAPFDGVVTNLNTQVGQWITPGEPLFSLIDGGSFHVVAFLKEQYLEPAVPGASAEVKLWQYPGERFAGTVASVGRGVYARNSSDGLPVVPKTLDWVQLAARIPVRIHLKTDKPLTMGGTAHVRIER